MGFYFYIEKIALSNYGNQISNQIFLTHVYILCRHGLVKPLAPFFPFATLSFHSPPSNWARYFGCGLKSVAYIQDGLLIRKLSFWVCI